MNDVKELYKAYENYIFRYLYRLTSDYHAAEELTQETFFQVVKSFHRFRGEAHVTTWLYKIARNVYSGWKRKNSLHTVDIERVELSNREGPSEAYERKETEAVIKDVFQRLPDKYREVLWLREWQGMSYEEIAAICDHSVDWVKVNIYRARNAFKQYYREKEGNFNE